MLVSNATLTAINSGAGAEDDVYDGPATPVGKWAGSVACYLDASTGRVTTAAGSTFERKWVVYVQYGSPPVVVEIGDTLTVQQAQADGTEATFVVPVLSVDDRSEPDMPADVQSTAMVVEPV